MLYHLEDLNTIKIYCWKLIGERVKEKPKVLYIYLLLIL
jgi:hypothetical protein